MKRLLLITLTLICGAAQAQVYSDGKGLTVSAKLYRIDKPKDATKPIHLVLKESVSVLSEPQGLNLAADDMTLNAVPTSNKGYQVNDAVAVGHVVVVKTAVSKTGKQPTRIEGPNATYKAGTKESTVSIAGPISIKSLDEAARPTMDATGNSGAAYLEPLKQTKLENALHRATMDGNVHLALTQYDLKSKTKTTVRTISDHMEIEEQPNGRKVTLTGSVQIDSDGVHMKGVKRAEFVFAKDGSLSVNTSEAR
jgi:hypothetical protein